MKWNSVAVRVEEEEEDFSEGQSKHSICSTICICIYLHWLLIFQVTLSMSLTMLNVFNACVVCGSMAYPEEDGMNEWRDLCKQTYKASLPSLYPLPYWGTYICVWCSCSHFNITINWLAPMVINYCAYYVCSNKSKHTHTYIYTEQCTPATYGCSDMYSKWFYFTISHYHHIVPSYNDEHHVL